MQQCLRQTLSHYPFAEGEKALVTVNLNDDFSFMGNEILMFQVLTNLLKNALEQIRQQQTGAITLFGEEEADGYSLHVKDTAGGVDDVWRVCDVQARGKRLALTMLGLFVQSKGVEYLCESVQRFYVGGDCYFFRFFS